MSKKPSAVEVPGAKKIMIEIMVIPATIHQS